MALNDNIQRWSNIMNAGYDNPLQGAQATNYFNQDIKKYTTPVAPNDMTPVPKLDAMLNGNMQSGSGYGKIVNDDGTRTYAYLPPTAPPVVPKVESPIAAQRNQVASQQQSYVPPARQNPPAMQQTPNTSYTSAIGGVRPMTAEAPIKYSPYRVNARGPYTSYNPNQGMFSKIGGWLGSGLSKGASMLGIGGAGRPAMSPKIGGMLGMLGRFGAGRDMEQFIEATNDPTRMRGFMETGSVPIGGRET